jgi:hypothetical protein
MGFYNSKTVLREICCQLQDKVNLEYVGFEVLTAVVMKITILWDTPSCRQYMNRCFGERYHIRLQGNITSSYPLVPI